MCRRFQSDTNNRKRACPLELRCAADNIVYCLNTADGSVVWKYATDAIVRSAPAFTADSQNFAIGSDGELPSKQRVALFNLGTSFECLVGKRATVDGETD